MWSTKNPFLPAQLFAILLMFATAGTMSVAQGCATPRTPTPAPDLASLCVPACGLGEAACVTACDLLPSSVQPVTVALCHVAADECRRQCEGLGQRQKAYHAPCDAFAATRSSPEYVPVADEPLHAGLEACRGE